MDDGSRISPEAEAFLRAARAGDIGTVGSMIKNNASIVNATEAGGFTALHFAAFNQNLELLALLVENKATLDVQNYDSYTPLMLAAKVEKHDAIDALIKAGADVNFTTEKGVTACHQAAHMGKPETIRHLISRGAKLEQSKAFPQGTIVHWAVTSGDPYCVGALVYDFKQNINGKDEHGGTPLFAALQMKNHEMVQFLLEHGADVNVAITAGDRVTPLHLAVEMGTLDDVKMLLARGANPLAEAFDGENHAEKVTPVDLATKAGKSESVKELTKKRTDEKRLEDAAKYKAHGNKVFANGESVKAAKFYSLAISLDHNHVFFSNRSACYYNMGQLKAAYYDAHRCIALNPTWPKGYTRKAATEFAMGRYDAALETCEAGLKLDKGNLDLTNIKNDVTKKQQQLAAPAAK